MRAGLSKSEPKRRKDWQDNKVYEQVLKKNEGHKKFVLHDGPPYANGPIHIGHAMNNDLQGHDQPLLDDAGL